MHTSIHLPFCSDETHFEELNGFDESFRRHQDWELYIRFFRKYLMISTFQMPLLIKHVTTTSVITNEPLKQIEYLEFFLNKYKMDLKHIKKECNISIFIPKLSKQFSILWKI